MIVQSSLAKTEIAKERVCTRMVATTNDNQNEQLSTETAVKYLPSCVIRTISHLHKCTFAIDERIGSLR